MSRRTTRDSAPTMRDRPIVRRRSASGVSVSRYGARAAWIAFLNVVTNRFFRRVDFTADRVYTLSQASRDLVAKLPDRMTVKAYISGDLQPPFSQVAQYTRDLLDEYAHASGGKLVWEALDPGSDPALKEEAKKAGVQEARRGRVSSDKLEIGASFLGMDFGGAFRPQRRPHARPLGTVLGSRGPDDHRGRGHDSSSAGLRSPD